MAYRKNQSLTAGIVFRPEILAFVDSMAEEEGRTRSNYINQLIKEHAEKFNVKLSAAPHQNRIPKQENASE
jgi:predicted DNA-binding protein